MEGLSLSFFVVVVVALAEASSVELGSTWARASAAMPHVSSSAASLPNSNSWGSLEADGVDLGKLSETEAAALATAAENRSRAVESPRVKKPRGRRGCLNATTSLVPQCVLLGLLALLRLLGGSGAEVVLAEAETTTAAADSRLVVVLLGGGTSPVLLEDIVHLCAEMLL